MYDRLRAADTDDEVGAAWIAVDLLRRVYQAPDRDTAHRRLVAFYEWVAHVEIDELTRLATTIDRWQEQVLAYFHTRATNAATESANGLAKRIKRVTFGLRNFVHWRIRVLLYAGKPDWPKLTTITPTAA